MMVAVAADGYAPPAYKAPEAKSDYHSKSYSKGRVNIQVTWRRIGLTGRFRAMHYGSTCIDYLYK